MSSLERPSGVPMPLRCFPNGMFDFVDSIEVECSLKGEGFEIEDTSKFTPNTEFRLEGMFRELYVLAPRREEPASILFAYDGGHIATFDIRCLRCKAGLFLRDQNDIGEHLFPNRYDRNDKEAELWVAMRETEEGYLFDGYHIVNGKHEELIFDGTEQSTT